MAKPDIIDLDLATLIALQRDIEVRIDDLKAQTASQILANLEREAERAGLTVADIVGNGRRRRKSNSSEPGFH